MCAWEIVQFTLCWRTSTLSEPLPATLLQGNEVTAFDELLNTYETTTGSTYNRKYPGGALSQPNHPLPPPHWKVNYNKDLWEKLKLRAWRTPEKSSSEMKTQFKGGPAQPTYSTFHSGPQSFSLENHLNKGPSQSIVATTENKGLSRDPYYIRDGGVLSLNDIYASTTMRDFRTFTAKELESYPKKDILTYWQAEDYPKVWGHGLKENPLSKESQPTLRRPPPMRDSMQFPTATKLPRIPPRARSVPHRGLKTLAQESYQQPLDAKRSHDVYFPLECPWTMPHTGPLPEIMSVPKMYETEYETYGSKQPVTV
ncbi:stabilizer of axonemal microtubules 3 isoform X2 [Pyxicephalus adspersus]|uniref:stabilizer of axonemal microtubules 3 isoform X2 n=1 Tax=Pyxicephalus adspersus TaxID=30357 RepID=UPI003B5C3029